MGSTSRTTRWTAHRTLAASIAAATAATLMPFATMPADASGPRDNDLSEFCEGAPEVTFDDESRFTAAQEEAADCVAAPELDPVIAEGKKDGNFAPDESVRRDQMAAFIGRMLLNVGVELPASPADQFDDDEQSAHELRINQLAALGVVDGRPDRNDVDNDGNTSELIYAPADTVRRDQMAKFINNSIGEAAGQTLVDTGGDDFVDDCDDSLEPHVNALAEANIVQGVGNDQYACDADVTRGQMVLFLARTLDYLAEHGEAENPFQTAPFKVTGVPSQPEPGETIIATVDAGEAIAKVEIDGCGLTDDVTTADEDSAAAGFQVVFTIPSTQPEGECILTFTVTTSDGDVLTDTIDVTIVADALTVTGVPAQVSKGQTITATVDAGEPVASVELDGCGITDDVTTADEDGAVTGFQVTFTIPTTQPEGPCTLTFTVTTEDGDVLTERVVVEVVAAPGNQSFLVQPTTEETRITSSADLPDRGRRFFEALGLDNTKQYVIALYPSEYVTVDASQTVRFLDGLPTDNVADFDGSVIDADIELVNGSDAAGGGDGVVTGVSPVSGKITFVIDSSLTDEVRPVVFFDQDGGSSATVPELDLVATVDGIGYEPPAEPFGVGGITTWIPPEQESGTIDVAQDDAEATPIGPTREVDVEFTDKNDDVFVGCELVEDNNPEEREDSNPSLTTTTHICWSFEYDTNDAFFLEAGSNDPPLSFSEFELRLSPGDDVSGTYASDSSQQSTFVLDDESPTPPTTDPDNDITTAEVATATATSEGNINVTFGESNTPTVNEYFIYRDDLTAGQTTECPSSFSPSKPGEFEVIGSKLDPTPRKDSNQTLTYTDTTAQPGKTYCYAVTSVDDGDQSNDGLVVGKATRPS